VVLAAIVQH